MINRYFWKIVSLKLIWQISVAISDWIRSVVHGGGTSETPKQLLLYIGIYN